MSSKTLKLNIYRFHWMYVKLIIKQLIVKIQVDYFKVTEQTIVYSHYFVAKTNFSHELRNSRLFLQTQCHNSSLLFL